MDPACVVIEPMTDQRLLVSQATLKSAMHWAFFLSPRHLFLATILSV